MCWKHTSSDYHSSTFLSEVGSHFQIASFQNIFLQISVLTLYTKKLFPPKKIIRLRKTTSWYKGILTDAIDENKVLDVCKNKDSKNYKSTT